MFGQDFPRSVFSFYVRNYLKCFISRFMFNFPLHHLQLDSVLNTSGQPTWNNSKKRCFSRIKSLPPIANSRPSWGLLVLVKTWGWSGLIIHIYWWQVFPGGHKTCLKLWLLKIWSVRFFTNPTPLPPLFFRREQAYHAQRKNKFRAFRDDLELELLLF